MSCRRAALAGGQSHSKKQFILLLKDELLAQAAQALEALFNQNSKLHAHTVLALRRSLSHGCVSCRPSFTRPTAPMHPHLHLETALLQHGERILSRTQQDTLLLAGPEHSECWQAHARRKSLSLDAGLVLAAVADGVSLSPQSAFASRSFLQALHAQADLGNSAGVEADFSDSEMGGDSGSNSETGSAAVQDRDWLHVWQGELVPGDAFLLATDGLHGCVPGFALQDHWQADQPLLENLNCLYAAWNGSGGGDDISLVALRFTER